MKHRELGLNIAVLGVTGAVGRELVGIIGERRLPVHEIKGYATAESLGQGVDYLDDEVIVRDIKDADFSQTDVVFIALPSSSSSSSSSSNLATGSDSTKSDPASISDAEKSPTEDIVAEYYKKAISSGSLVIEASGMHALQPEVSSLVVPELNGKCVQVEAEKAGEKTKGVGFSCPIGASVALGVVLAPLSRVSTLQRVVVSTYQAVSNSGRGGMDELWKQTVALFNGDELEQVRFPQQIAFNCFPQVGEFDADGNTGEERRIIAETRTILEMPSLPISVTAAQIPVFNCCALSINVQFADEVSPDRARKILSESFGVIVQDEPSEKAYPTSFELGGSDAVYVGRIRKDCSVEHGLSLWVVVDNLRKGSALNAVEILELALASAWWKSGGRKTRLEANLH